MDILAALDQAGALLRDFAPVVKKYYESLLKEGFSKEEALILTVEMQKSIMPK